jgi:hypothetical protein
MLLGFGVSFTCRCQGELRRIDAALNRVEPGTLAPILRALGFHSLEDRLSREPPKSGARSRASGGKYPLNPRRQRRQTFQALVYREDRLIILNREPRC